MVYILLSCVNVVRPKAKEHIKPRSSTTTTTTTFLFKLNSIMKKMKITRRNRIKKPETISWCLIFYCRKCVFPMCKRITIKHFSKKEHYYSLMTCRTWNAWKKVNKKKISKKTVVKLRTNRKRRHHQQTKIQKKNNNVPISAASTFKLKKPP